MDTPVSACVRVHVLKCEPALENFRLRLMQTKTRNPDWGETDCDAGSSIIHSAGEWAASKQQPRASRLSESNYMLMYVNKSLCLHKKKHSREEKQQTVRTSCGHNESTGCTLELITQCQVRVINNSYEDGGKPWKRFPCWHQQKLRTLQEQHKIRKIKHKICFVL